MMLVDYCIVVVVLSCTADEMGPMLLRLLMMVAVDGFSHENAIAKNAVRWLSEKVMTIVSTNFDLMPNAILDSMLNACNLFVLFATLGN